MRRSAAASGTRSVTAIESSDRAERISGTCGRNRPKRHSFEEDRKRVAPRHDAIQVLAEFDARRSSHPEVMLLRLFFFLLASIKAANESTDARSSCSFAHRRSRRQSTGTPTSERPVNSAAALLPVATSTASPPPRAAAARPAVAPRDLVEWSPLSVIAECALELGLERSNSA
jgi:hypothetical protein